MWFTSQHAALAAINAFLEDTCVIVVVAYLLTRGHLFALLTAEHRAWRGVVVLGSVLGVIGITEDVFPGARYPYVTETLVLTFTMLACGPRVGFVTAFVICVGDFVFRPFPFAVATLPVVASCLLVGSLGRWVARAASAVSARRLLLGGALIGMVTQAATVFVRFQSARHFAQPFSLPHALFSIPANGAGVFLLELIVQEARVRRESERHRLEAEQARAEVEQSRAMIAETQLMAVRARLHPHFLFNTLSSIAALCGVAPREAETSIVRLANLMRRALESDVRTPTLLSDEIEDACAYVEIQQMRLGKRLRVEWRLDPVVHSRTVTPPFSLLTLLENAINHGIASKVEPSVAAIVVRPLRRSRTRRVLIAVLDSGSGMSAAQRMSALHPTDHRAHGLPLLSEQLRLLYGASGRLRFFSRPDAGTLAVFCVPEVPAALTRGEE